MRREVRSLSAGERRALIDALLVLKKEGVYDRYVHAHHAVMTPAVLPDELYDANYGNGAHMGPSFLPWHREMLLRLEDDLRRVDGSLTLPFWDWTIDSALPDPKQSPLWADDFLGGDGAPADEQFVKTGPFAGAERWPIPADLDGPALKRQFASIVPTLPTAADVALALREVFYDTPPYNRSPFTLGFRNRLEGWISRRGDHRVVDDFSQLHNRVHLWVGGSMVEMTSPNAPVFFLHHCFIDKLWADWQRRQMENNPEAAPHYAPRTDGPSGHNLDDVMNPWGGRRVRDLLEIAHLGYSYEVSPATLEKMVLDAVEGRPRRRSPFAIE